MILLCKALYRAFAVFVQSSLQVVCHAGVQDSISFVGQKVDIILFHALTAFLGVEFAEAFLLSERVLRDCHVGLRPPRNDKSGGQHCFNGGRYGSGVPSRDCHVASLLAMTNRRCVPFLRWLVPNGSAFPRLPRRFAPRNDKSGAILILTVTCTNRQQCAGRGTPRLRDFRSIIIISRRQASASGSPCPDSSAAESHQSACPPAPWPPRRIGSGRRGGRSRAS